MATTTRWKMIPWVLGIACLAITLIGANNLLQPAAPQDRGTVMPTLKANGPASLGPVVNGTVATEVEIGEYVAPEVLQLAKVTKILVKQNQLVKVGDPLIQFDDTQPKKKMEVAQAAVGTAKVSVAKAELAKKIHPKNISLQNLAINKATVELNAAKLARSTPRPQWRTGPMPCRSSWLRTEAVDASTAWAGRWKRRM